MLRIILILALLLGPAGSAMAQVDYTNTELADPAQERQAKALMDTIRCVVCQGQPISGSNAELHPSSAPLWLIPIIALIAGFFLIRGRFKRKES
jgi:cytochrome c-type biogenesis protein CcmH/NrfF